MYPLFNLQIVVALLFGCSVTKCTGNDLDCKNVSLISYERRSCENKGHETVDRYFQIQCDGQSCNATCDGPTSQNPNTSKSVRVRKIWFINIVDNVN